MLISMSPNGGKKLERNGPHMLVKPDTESLKWDMKEMMRFASTKFSSYSLTLSSNKSCRRLKRNLAFQFPLVDTIILC